MQLVVHCGIVYNLETNAVYKEPTSQLYLYINNISALCLTNFKATIGCIAFVPLTAMTPRPFSRQHHLKRLFELNLMK